MALKVIYSITFLGTEVRQQVVVPRILLTDLFKSQVDGGNSSGIFRFTESQNHRMARVGRDLRDHEAPTPMPQAGPPASRLPRAPSNLALNTSRDGASTASLGSLFNTHHSLGKELPPDIQPKSSLL